MTSKNVSRRVRFIKDFDYKPRSGITIAYKAGETKFVHAACAAKALALGRAEPVEISKMPAGLAKTIGGRKRRRRKDAAGAES